MKIKNQFQRNKAAEDDRLSLLSQELGVAAMMVLVNDYEFSQAQADEFLGKMLNQAKTNRMMITAQGVVEVFNNGGRPSSKS